MRLLQHHGRGVRAVGPALEQHHVRLDPVDHVARPEVVQAAETDGVVGQGPGGGAVVVAGARLQVPGHRHEARAVLAVLAVAVAVVAGLAVRDLLVDPALGAGEDLLAGDLAVHVGVVRHRGGQGLGARRPRLRSGRRGGGRRVVTGAARVGVRRVGVGGLRCRQPRRPCSGLQLLGRRVGRVRHGRGELDVLADRVRQGRRPDELRRGVRREGRGQGEPGGGGDGEGDGEGGTECLRRGHDSSFEVGRGMVGVRVRKARVPVRGARCEVRGASAGVRGEEGARGSGARVRARARSPLRGPSRARTRPPAPAGCSGRARRGRSGSPSRRCPSARAGCGSRR